MGMVRTGPANKTAIVDRFYRRAPTIFIPRSLLYRAKRSCNDVTIFVGGSARLSAKTIIYYGGAFAGNEKT